MKAHLWRVISGTVFGISLHIRAGFLCVKFVPFSFFFPSMAKLILCSLWGKHSPWLDASRCNSLDASRCNSMQQPLPVVVPLAASVSGFPWLVRNCEFGCSWECIGCVSFHCPVTLLRLQKSSLPMNLCWSAVNGRISSGERCCPWMLEWRLTVCCVHD